jgi:RHH-type proline utilization regulon transcriptional repressor/proline dehydrogenase/delta 1-pyrroline-5-carboxylate dehydrogenase
MWQGEAGHGRALRQALAARDGAILPLWTSPDMARLQPVERHVCIDTTAAGGNAALLAASGPD